MATAMARKDLVHTTLDTKHANAPQNAPYSACTVFCRQGFVHVPGYTNKPISVEQELGVVRSTMYSMVGSTDVAAFFGSLLHRDRLG